MLSGIAELSRLQSLTELRVPANSISRLAIPAGSFSAMKVLDVSFNNMKSDSLIALASLPCLVKLDISGNNIDILTEFKREFPSLRTLIAGQNAIHSEGLLSLQNLPQLKELHLPSNPIKEVPERCNKFFELEWLDLSCCQIDQIGKVAAVQNFQKLAKVHLHGNPFVSLQRLSKYKLARKDGRKLAILTEERQAIIPKRQAISELYSTGTRTTDTNYVNGRPQAFEFISRDALESAFERLEESSSEFKSSGLHQREAEHAAPATTEEADVPDGTFLTSLAGDTGIDDDDDDHIEPTLRVARDLGLDPAKLTSWDHIGLDATAAINALKFALQHPLVDDHDTGKIANHQKLTLTAEMRRLSSINKRGSAKVPKPKPSKRKQAIYETLEKMKERLTLAKEKLSTVG